jgi:hypothetical protein
VLCPHSPSQMESKCEGGSALSSFLLTDGIEVLVWEGFVLTPPHRWNRGWEGFCPHSYTQMESKCEGESVLSSFLLTVGLASRGLLGLHSSAQMEARGERGSAWASFLPTDESKCKCGCVLSSLLLTDCLVVRGWGFLVLVPPHRWNRRARVEFHS